MPARKLLFVGWDAADWKVLNPLVENGEMPVFSRLVERGTIADIITLEPVLSPLLWNSIATGKPADEHGILGFTEVDPVSGRVRPVTSVSRRTKAVWNMLSQQGLRTHVVGWFGSHPAEPIRGVCVSDAYTQGFRGPRDPWPLPAGSVHPASAAAALESLRLAPHDIDGELIRLFIPRAAEIDLSRPNPLPNLRKILAESFTIHAAATWAMENVDWDFMAVYYIGIDHFSHAFMNYHPPRMDWIDPAEFELYRDVVNGGYRLMDLFLGRLLQLAGPDTTVMIASDHGFHSDHLRPPRIPKVPTGPAEQHRPLGMFALAGEGIRRDERIYGVGLLDIAPTLLALFDLPAGNDMSGRVLSEAFEKPPLLDRIPGWDGREGDSGMHPPGTLAPPEDTDLLLDQFVALGYIEAQPEDRDLAAALCRRETKWNLARVYTGGWRFEAALPLLEELHAEAPERTDFALALADCRLRLGLFDEAEEAAAEVMRERPGSPLAQFLLGNIAFAQGRFRESLSLFAAAESAGPRTPELAASIGLAWLKLRRWPEAEQAFERVLALDPHSPIAHQGLARVRLRFGRLEEAAESALFSIACRHDLPLSHFLLGAALVRLGNRERAIQAFETSLSFRPPLRQSHRMLAALYGDSPQGREHAQASREFQRERRDQIRRLEAVRQEARHRAIDRRALDSAATARQRVPPQRDSESSEQGGGKGPALTFTIVSGLPRSGTSLMMRMIEAAGLPVMTDGLRRADEDNPEGYYEWEAIRKIAVQPALLREAEGRVVKVISALLPALPAAFRYKVIFMDRPVGEVVESQRKMIRRRGAPESEVSPEKMAQLLAEHRDMTLSGLAGSERFEVLVVNFPELVKSPENWVPAIQAFLGPLPSPEAMAGVVRAELYRNRADRNPAG